MKDIEVSLYVRKVEFKEFVHSVMDYYSPWNFLGQDTGVGSQFPSPGDLPNPGTEPRSPVLQVDSLPAEPPGKPHS